MVISSASESGTGRESPGAGQPWEVDRQLDSPNINLAPLSTRLDSEGRLEV